MIGLMAMLFATSIFAAALSNDRNTPSRSLTRVNLSVYTNTLIYAGGMISVNSSGYAIRSTSNSTQQVVGRAATRVDNQTITGTQSGASGAKTLDVDVGIFGWTNPGDALTDADIGKIAYVVDDNTVTNDAYGGNNVAGIIVDVDSDYVWVDTRQFNAAASAPATLAVTGAGTIGTTLGVTGASTLSGGSTLKGTVGLTGSTNTATGTTIISGIYSNTATKTFGGGTTTISSPLTINGGTNAISGAITISGATIVSNALIKVGGLQAYTNAMAVQQIYYVPANLDGTNYNVLCVF